MELAPLVLLFALAAPQLDTSPPEPEAAEIFYAFRAGKLFPLERQTPVWKHHAVGFMVLNTRSVREFAGAASPVRFNAEERLEFVVRSGLKLDTMDPNTIYCVRKLDRRKKTRELLLSAGWISPAGVNTKSDPHQGAVPVAFTTYGEHSIKIIAGPLKPGEYAVSRVYGPAFFCFGVD
jgi:hypothetical protein